MEIGQFKKELFTLYSGYLKASTPLEKAAFEEALKRLVEIGENQYCSSPNKTKSFTIVLDLYRKYTQADNPLDQAEFEKQLTTILDELLRKTEPDGLDFEK